MGSLWRQRADVLPSAIVGGLFVLQLAAFFLIDSIGWLFVAMLLFLAFSACPGSISHNHHHYPTFRYQWMNRIYEVILFLQTGIPPLGWTIHHNIGHHKLYLDQHEDPSAWLNDDGTVMSRIKYDLYNATRVYPEIMQIGRTRPKLYRQFKTWTTISLFVLGALFIINPLATLILFVLPMPLMLIGLLDNTYQQHQGLDVSSDYTASRNTTSKLYNMISWNLGYHTAHHMNPSLHWSKLPEFHHTIAHRIPRNLICDSVLLSTCDTKDVEKETVPAKPVTGFSSGETPRGNVLAQRRHSLN